jgi:hypothetical protein
MTANAFGGGKVSNAGRSSGSCRSQRNADIPIGKFRGILASWTARSGDLATCRLGSQRYRQLVDAPREKPSDVFLQLFHNSPSLIGKTLFTERTFEIL